MSKEEIEEMLCEYLNCEKVLWVKDGIDPEETNGHIDDVACFVKPGEVACIYTEDKESPFYEAAKAAYESLCEMTDAKGRKLKVHKLCCPKGNVTIQGDFNIDKVPGSIPIEDGEILYCILYEFPDR
jgi:agmatine deiminase